MAYKKEISSRLNDIRMHYIIAYDGDIVGMTYILEQRILYYLKNDGGATDSITYDELYESIIDLFSHYVIMQERSIKIRGIRNKRKIVYKLMQEITNPFFSMVSVTTVDDVISSIKKNPVTIDDIINTFVNEDIWKARDNTRHIPSKMSEKHLINATMMTEKAFCHYLENKSFPYSNTAAVYIAILYNAIIQRNISYDGINEKNAIIKEITKNVYLTQAYSFSLTSEYDGIVLSGRKFCNLISKNGNKKA